ncbi:MAG: acyloxyacyl hydrolase [Lishizhenia sp.]
MGISTKMKGGTLIAHRPVMAHLVQSHTLAFELALIKRSAGKKAWQQQLNCPNYGVSIFASSTGNREIIGNACAINAFIDLKILGNTKFYLSARLAGGIGYVSKPFNQENNPKNVAIGSYLNGFIQFGTHVNYAFKKQLFSFGIDMSHFSNGSAKLPNLGLNLPYLSLGYTRFQSEYAKEYHEKNVIFSKKWSWSALGFLAPKQVFPTGGRTSPVYGISFLTQKRFTPLSGIEFGIDFVSNQSHFDIYKEIEKTQLKVLQIGLYSSYLFYLTQTLNLYTGIGAYVKNSLDPAGYIYNRLGIRYCGKNRLLLNIGIKANFAKADYFEYGIGYRFK